MIDPHRASSSGIVIDVDKNSQRITSMITNLNIPLYDILKDEITQNGMIRARVEDVDMKSAEPTNKPMDTDPSTPTELDHVDETKEGVDYLEISPVASSNSLDFQLVVRPNLSEP